MLHDGASDPTPASRPGPRPHTAEGLLLSHAAQGGGGTPATASGDDQRASAVRRALVVDDEPDIRETLGEILEHAGYQVDLALSGFDALERVRAVDYDIVLSDIRMPRMTGIEFYRQLRHLRPALAERFIVVTGDALSGQVRSFLDETGVPYIQKPFVPSDVRRLVALAQAAGNAPRRG